jgi:23S rRNA pseudouridine2605 synthase
MTAPGERIAKKIARAGLCSRRDAERLIAAGRVAIDGVVIDSPAINVTPEMRVSVDEQPLPEPGKSRLWRYHKPRGLITSHRDPQGRPTVFDALPPDIGRVISVGRLDITSEGLLLLTNDGGLARHLELPSTGWIRRYRARVNGHPDAAALAALAKGLTLEDVRYGPIQASLDSQRGDNAWLTVALAEGKNREVRRVLEHRGWQVSRLIRLAYGPFQLGKMAPGSWREVPSKVVAEQLTPDARPKHHAHRRR